MSYTILTEGDQLPSVGVMQKLLNARAGASLVADGEFTQKMTIAVMEFQNQRLMLNHGNIGRETYFRLTQCESRLNIVDFVDIFDGYSMDYEVSDITKAGGNPIYIGGMSNGVDEAVTKILKAAKPGSVFILRLHGHGSPGSVGISEGDQTIDNKHGSALTTDNWIYFEPIIRRLKPIFGPYGCIELMHCSPGRGLKGRFLINKIARTIGVPVTGAFKKQRAGGHDTFMFEGPTYTAIPGGGSLKSWCQALPDFIPLNIY